MLEQLKKTEAIKPELNKRKKVMVAVSELRGDNLLDDQAIRQADAVELKFFLEKIFPDQKGILEKTREKPRTIHLLPYYQRGDEKIWINLADINLLHEIERLGLPEKVERVDPKQVSLHLMAATTKIHHDYMGRYEVVSDGKFDPQASMVAEEGRVLEREELLETICKNIGQVKNLFGDREILLENIDYAPDQYSGGASRFIAEPNFIREVLDKTEAGLLLDLEHAYVTAKNMGLEFSEYLDQLPLDKVREIHLSRPSGFKRSQRLKEIGRTPKKEDLDSDILVDVHRAFINEKDELFIKRVLVILKRIWEKMPNLEMITLELNLPPDQLRKNMEVVRTTIGLIENNV